MGGAIRTVVFLRGSGYILIVGGVLVHPCVTHLETGSWPSLGGGPGWMRLCRGSIRGFQSKLTLLLTSLRGKMFLEPLSGLVIHSSLKKQKQKQPFSQQRGGYSAYTQGPFFFFPRSVLSGQGIECRGY